jgi:hypothetical protein
VQSADGQVTMRGGYYTAAYDPRVSSAGEQQVADQVGALIATSYVRPATRRKHTKRRAEQFADALSLDPGIMQQHLLQVAHDLAFRETIRSVGNLIFDPRTKATLTRHIGAEKARVFPQWLKDVAQPNAVIDSHAGAVGRFLRKVRSNVVVGALGYAIDNFIADPLSVVSAPIATDLKARALGSGLTLYLRQPLKTRAFALEKSGEVRFRAQDAKQDLERQTRSITAKGGVPGQAMQWFKDHAFWVAEKIDEVNTTIIWYSAYRQASLHDGRAEAEAVAFADNVLQQTLPSFNNIDKAAIQRDQGLLGATVAFYGFMNLLYNTQRRILQPALTGKADSQAKAITVATGQMLALVAVQGLLAEMLVGRGPEPGDGDDDGERWLNWAIRKGLMAPITWLPFVGGMVESWALGKKPSIRSSTAFAVFDSIARAAKRAWDTGGDGERVGWEMARALFMFRGVPTRPLRWAEYWANFVDGEAGDTSVPGAVSGTVYGERENQPLNPITAVQQLVGE